MTKRIRTEKELAEAIKNNQETIEIEGSLKEKTIRIRAIGKVAWVIAIGAIGAGFYGLLAAPATRGGSLVVDGFMAPVAVSALGVGATYSSFVIAVVAGGVGALNSLRGYKEVSRSNGILVLKR